MRISEQNNISFKARCPQLRDADWVCRKVNKIFPFYDPSKLTVPIIDHFERTKTLLPIMQSSPKSLNDIACAFNEMRLRHFFVKKDLTQLKISSGQQKTWPQIQKENKDLKILGSIEKELLTFFLSHGKYRMLWNREQKTLAESMCKYSIGASDTSAHMAAMTLHLNGIKNATVCRLVNTETGKVTGHTACVFNRDGSKFFLTGITKNTIVIDPWAGKADFAGNMLKLYKNLYKREFNITDGTKLALEEIKDTNFYKYARTQNGDIDYSPKAYGFKEYVKELKTKLIYPNKNHNFMQMEKVPEVKEQQPMGLFARLIAWFKK